MKKRKNNLMKKFQKKSFLNKNKITIIGLSIILIIAVAALIIGLTKESVTGSSVYIKHYGVSTAPLSEQAGKVQTYIDLTQPTLKEIGKTNSLEQQRALAEEITKTADFANDLLQLYRISHPTTLNENSLEAFKTGAITLADNFKEDTHCLKRIGENYGYRGEMKVVLISELIYQECKDATKLFAYAKHTFLDYDGNYFLCSQDSDKLFVIEKGTGRINSNTADC